VQVSTTTVEEFLHGADEDMRTLDRVIAAAMPGRSRALWEGVFWGGTEQRIIGYGDLVQQRPRGAEVRWFVLGLAQQKSHYSLYVNAVEEGAYLSHTYGPRLGKVRIGAASIAFSSADAVDLAVLAELAAASSALCPPSPR
jgi:hypothetical protein